MMAAQIESPGSPMTITLLLLSRDRTANGKRKNGELAIRVRAK
jgi:hypothetical protein